MGELEPYLEDLENRIDPEVEDRLYAEWFDFCERGFRGDIFSPSRGRTAPPGIEWPAVSVNAALEDYDQMALQQFGGASHQLTLGNGSPMCVRSNYGTCILPSLFGAELFKMDEELNTLPTNWPLAGGADTVRRLIGQGVPELRAGYGERALEMGARFMALKKRYPLVDRYVHVYHPDLQGPLDLCELLWGSSLFLALVDEAELVKDFIALIAETYTRFLEAWYEVVPPGNGLSAHWMTLHKGRIMLRDDSAMNVSPEMVAEFARPYDAQLLAHFGGGCIHFCGRGDHYIDQACAIPDMHAIYMSQPECNDMERIYRNTVDQGIALVSFSRAEAERALAAGRDLHGRVHCAG